jgi:phosphoribosylamine--glycine ligase
MEPVVQALRDQGTPYKGILYAGLMLTSDGPKVIEFNCRMGDPEAQVLLPRMKTDLLEVCLATARGDLSDVDLKWDPSPWVGVVVASAGYPTSYETGFAIEGLDDVDDDAIVFQAATQTSGEDIVTDGGRVLTVVATGATHGQARERAYENVAKIRFQNAFHRRDIAESL